MSFHGDGGFDDKDLDDAALWAVIDSAAASLSTATTSTSTSKYRKPLATRNLNRNSPIISFPIPSPSPPSKNPRIHRMSDGEVLHENPPPPRPHKIARSHASTELVTTSPPALVMVKHVQRTPAPTPSETYSCSSPDYPPPALIQSPIIASVAAETETEIRTPMIHSLSGRFPSVSLFKDYQNAAMAILEKSDYTMISGSPYIKKTGWRKISFYFNLSFEIKDKTIEFDENRNVQRAEFIVRAHMQGGRFSDGWGSCERREKRFLKPNHDIPSTAETRAKNKACQDLLGIGEYRPGLNAQK